MAKRTREGRDWEILKIRVTTNLGEFKGDLREDLDINIDDLVSSFVDQPGKYAWWAVLASQARAIADSCRSQVDYWKDYMNKTLMAELDSEVRSELEENGEKITEVKVERGIHVHDKYLEAVEEFSKLKDAYLKANADATILESAREAMDERKDMLISLGAQLRAEGSNTELAIKKEKAKEVLKRKNNNRLKADM